MMALKTSQDLGSNISASFKIQFFVSSYDSVRILGQPTTSQTQRVEVPSLFDRPSQNSNKHQPPAVKTETSHEKRHSARTILNNGLTHSPEIWEMVFIFQLTNGSGKQNTHDSHEFVQELLWVTIQLRLKVPVAIFCAFRVVAKHCVVKSRGEASKCITWVRHRLNTEYSEFGSREHRKREGIEMRCSALCLVTNY